MSAAGANFYRILSETIKQAGVEKDVQARTGIYDRARNTVLARASAGDAANVVELQRGMDEAIAAIEMRLADATPRTDLAALADPAPSHTRSQRLATGPNPADRLSHAPVVAGSTAHSSLTHEPAMMMSHGSAALAVALPDAHDDLDNSRNVDTGQPQLMSRTAEARSNALPQAEEPTNDDESQGVAERLRANVFPLWQKLNPTQTSRGGAALRPEEAEPVEPSREEVLESQPASPYKSADHERDAALKTNASSDDNDDPLDRVAADIAEGFRYIEELAGANNRQDDVDAIGLSEPDEDLVRKVGVLVSDTPEDDKPANVALRRNLRLPRIPALPKIKLPKVRISAPTAIVSALALLIGGTATYFGLNPAPANPQFAAAAVSAGLIPDVRSLDSTGWVTTDLEIAPLEDRTWSAFRVTDDSNGRFGKLAAPLNDIASPKGFRITVRFEKSEQRLAHFAAIRVTAPYTRRAYTSDAQLDLTTGEVRAAGRANVADISVIDDGESWRLTLEARLEGEVLFSKPRLEIFPAAGSEFGTYSATTTGGAVVGDIIVQKL